MAKSDNENLYNENLEIVEYLQSSRLFGHLTQDVLNLLEPLSEIVEYPEGTEILTEGHENDRVFLLMRGEVEVFAKGESILSLKRNGDIFGEMSIISSKPCSATVKSKTTVTVFTISAKNIGKYSDAHQGDIRNFMYRVFAMILTEKLTLTTAKARQYESTNKLLEQTKVSLEQKIVEQKLAEENRLKLESQLRHSQKLEAIGTLAGGIAHDFNNLLFTMLGYVTMAKSELPEDSRARQDLDESLIAGRRAKELVQQILTFSRHQEGENKPVQISPLIKETVKFIRSTLPRNITIAEEIDQNQGIILGDPSQIHQVVMNLCTNAGHAMKASGGLLTIKLSQSYVDSENADRLEIDVGDYLILSVIDTGCGIKKELKGRIFDPFFTTKPVGEGSGMGLAVVHGIVKNYNGAISVESVEGEGSGFHVYLPIIPDTQYSDIKSDEIDKTGNEKILVVNGEASISSLMKRTLEKAGYETTAVTNGKEAQKVISEKPASFDLMVTDQILHDISGAELSVIFKTANPEAKIIMTFGHQSELDNEKPRLTGVDGHLVMPIEPDKLSRDARDVLDSE